MPVKDGPSCPHCGLPNYEGLCPHCRGDQDAYERELVPPFETTRPEPELGEEHRAGVFEAARVEGNGIVRCYAADLPGGYVCSGRLEAAHFIAVQTLRIKQSEARIYIETQHDPRMALAPGIIELVNAELSALVADPRNGLPLCSEHHATFDGKRPPRRLSLTPPPSVVDFATEYGLLHLLEPASNERREAA